MESALSAGASSELNALLELSARIGRDPLLVQAASGNTSIKVDGILWIKASGKWLAHADREDILVPVQLDETLRCIAMDVDPAGQTVAIGTRQLGTSVETAMHAVLRHRVVIHVHSVNTIALGVRCDGAAEIASRLRGMDWAWIPYVPSGLALAHAVEEAVIRNPCVDVMVLANHGLVVGAESCDAAERLLAEVECRMEAVPRWAAEPDIVLLQGLAASSACWRVPRMGALHAAATDAVSRRILCGGILYPCQAIFLTARARCIAPNSGADVLREIEEPFVLVEGSGMLVRDRMNAAESATLEGLAEVLRRIPRSAAVHYLEEHEVGELLCADVYRYRQRAEGNCPVPVSFHRNRASVQTLA